MRFPCHFIPAALSALTFGLTAAAGNIDLSTVPKRDSVQLTIYNSEDLTLVRETRVVTFKKGSNQLQFSWANTLIDPSSVELKFESDTPKLDVIDTTFPHDKPQMLYWNVSSELDGEATVQITYFTSGIRWSADYVCIADEREETLDIDGNVRVSNQSGEDYPDAEVRLVVGTINLVEKIADLAKVPISGVEKLEDKAKKNMRMLAARSMMDRSGALGGSAMPAEEAKAKEVIKEGLSEYFIYTIEGTETIPNSWSKRLRSFEGNGVPIKMQYRCRPEEYGDQLVRMYVMSNNEESQLGSTPLPDGVVRVFRDNGHDGLSYLTQQAIKYVPIGDKIELNLGVDPNVVFELVKLRASRDKIWMLLHDSKTFREVGRGVDEVETNATVAGWDDHSIFRQQIRNYTDKSIDVEIRRTFDGHAVFRSQLEPTLHDYRTAEFRTHLDAGATKNLVYEVLTHQGHNAKQTNMAVETAAVSLK